EPAVIRGDVFALISPHAAYEFSGKTAAYGYKALEGRDYDTVIILGPGHYVDLRIAALWPKGAFRTPLGEIPVDELMSRSLMQSCSLFFPYSAAFDEEHSIEAQLPFLQSVLGDFRVVPIILGDINFSDCRDLALAISEAMKDRNCLLVVSSDMYHGFDYRESELKDMYTLSLIRQLKARELYDRIQTREAGLCGWAGVIISMLAAEHLGYDYVKVLNYTNSAEVSGQKVVGEYCVGYSSVVISKKSGSPGSKPPDKKGGVMLNENQKKRLLEIARSSIANYLRTGKKLEVSEKDPVLLEHRGSFVTLHKNGKLRGCIGNIVADQPLYLTVRDMAVEAAVSDSRFRPVTEKELAGIEIEISVLSPLERIDNPDVIKMGEHGVLLEKGGRGGVFLPQVATETGWSKEEFLSNLCAHKAGLPPSAWKDPSADIYIFTAEVFSE
ncbi:MAG: AmmeMemoRadiSam system protein B, partial [Candidatus Omnitrophota bacterium]